MNKQISLEPLTANCSVIHVVKSSYGNRTLSKAIPWPYHFFYINRFFADRFLKQGNTQFETPKEAVGILKKDFRS